MRQEGNNIPLSAGYIAKLDKGFTPTVVQPNRTERRKMRKWLKKLSKSTNK